MDRHIGVDAHASTCTLGVIGPSRVLFGTDSSFYPRGWQKPIYDAQVAALDRLGASEEIKAQVFGGNFDRLFPLSEKDAS